MDTGALGALGDVTRALVVVDGAARFALPDPQAAKVSTMRITATESVPFPTRRSAQRRRRLPWSTDGTIADVATAPGLVADPIVRFPMWPATPSVGCSDARRLSHDRAPHRAELSVDTDGNRTATRSPPRWDATPVTVTK